MPDRENRSVISETSLWNQVLKEVQMHRGIFSWVAAEIQLSRGPQMFVVGRPEQTGSVSGEQYENSPLAPASRYQVSVVAVNRHGSELLSGSVALARPIMTTGGPLPSPGDNLLYLLLLLLLIIPVLGCLAYIRLKKKKNNNRSSFSVETINILYAMSDQGTAPERYAVPENIPTGAACAQQDNISEHEYEEIEDGYTLLPVFLPNNEYIDVRLSAPYEEIHTPPLLQEVNPPIPVHKLEQLQ